MGLSSIFLGEGMSLAGLGLGVFSSLQETKRQKSADTLKQKEIDYQIAREKADAARVASEGVTKLIWSNAIKGVLTFVGIVTGGAILGTLIKKIMRRR